jgi:hypothetical protein
VEENKFSPVPALNSFIVILKCCFKRLSLNFYRCYRDYSKEIDSGGVKAEGI